jgi:DNA-binding transcriptional LysR family regulator
VLAPWQELPDRARARDVDLIVVELSQVQLMDDFAVQALSEHGLVVVCQPRHPLAGMDSPSPAAVFSYPVAGPSLTPAPGRCCRTCLPASQRAQQKKRGLLAVECDLSGMLKDVLRNSHAISLMPAFMVAPEVAAGQLVCVPGVDLGCACGSVAPGSRPARCHPWRRASWNCWPSTTAAWRPWLSLCP